MEVDALSPSPLARYLLELERRGASGRLEVGGRRLLLHDGAITDVLPADGDLSLLGFLTAAGRLSEQESEQLPEDVRNDGGARLDQEVLRRQLLDRGVLSETRRALWLDRLVRGVARDEEDGAPPRNLEPHGGPAGPYRVATLPLILDALARRAGRSDAERIGHHATASFEWLNGDEQLGRAQRWAELGEAEGARPVSAVLLSHPGAASRIAALVRAGLARLTLASDAPPAPDRRQSPSIPPPARRKAPSDPPTTSVSPPAEVVDPGALRLPPGPIGITPVAARFGAEARPLEDPLDALERRIAAAEQARMAGPQRALLWLEYARVALEHYGCVEEAARAAREAAAADPESADAHRTAAESCAAIGQPSVAYAYAKAAAALVESPRQRALALSEVARLAQRAGKPTSALRALEEAANAPHADGFILEQLARVELDLRNVPAAVQWARQAALKSIDLEPTTATHLLAWANALMPAEPSLASEYASQLAQQGFGEAAAAALLRAARVCDDTETRAQLRSNAAIRAELAGRPDVAAEALLDCFEEDPRRQALHEPLVTNLTATGASREAALLAEEIAGVCSPEARGPWLLRAIGLHLENAAAGPSLSRLLGEAMKQAESHEAALALAEQLAARRGSMRPLTDALEICATDASVDRVLRLKVVERLVEGARELSAPALERWAHALRRELDGTPLSDDDMARLTKASDAGDRATLGIEVKLERAPMAERIRLLGELATRWRDDPQRRVRAARQFEHVLDLSPDDEELARQFCDLAWLMDDLEALQRTAVDRAAEAPTSLLLAGAYAARMRGAFAEACDLCLAVLEREPTHEEALALLSRAERAGLSAQRSAQAAAAHLRGSTDPRKRSRALTRLAETLLTHGDVLGALQAAERALSIDPRAARAAEIATEHYVALDDIRAIAVLRTARRVLGDHPHLLWQLSQAAGLAGDRARQIEALEALARQSPFLSGPMVELLRARAQSDDDPQTLARCIEGALESTRRSPNTAVAVLEALERLWKVGSKEPALQLAVRAADALGEGAESLLRWAERGAAALDLPRVRGTVLERLSARLGGDERLDCLRQLARLEREAERTAWEARVWLRVLGLAPGDEEALDRLSTLYGAAGDGERMLSVLTLRLESSHDPEKRLQAQLDLAAASLAMGDEPSAAADMVQRALGDAVTLDTEIVRHAVGMLMSHSGQAAFDLLLSLAADERHAPMAGDLYQEAVALAAGPLGQPALALTTALMGLEQVPSQTPMLLYMEKLSLDEDDPDLALSTFDTLIERSLGQHGRRALLYRKARFLERAGRLSDALDAYVQGFEIDPVSGVVLASIERLSEHCSRTDVLVQSLLRLTQVARSTERRAELFARAADLAERKLADPRRALDVCLEAWKSTGQARFCEQAARALRLLGEREPKAQADAARPYVQALTERAEQAWDAAAKVQILQQLALLHAVGMADEGETAVVVEGALDALDADTDDLDEGLGRARQYAALGRLLVDRRMAPGLAQRALDAGTGLQAELPELKQLEALLTNASRATERPGPASTQPPPIQREHEAPRDPGDAAGNDAHVIQDEVPTDIPRAFAAAEPYQEAQARTSEPPRAGVVRVPGARVVGNPAFLGTTGATLPPPAMSPMAPVSLPPARVPVEAAVEADASHELAGLCTRVAAGDESAAARILETVHGRSDMATIATEQLLARARDGQASDALLGSLASLGPLTGRDILRVVAREALADRAALDFAHGIHALRTDDVATQTALALARRQGPSHAARRILELTWQHAAPLFRSTLSAYGVTTGDILHGEADDPFIRAHAAAVELTGQACELYLAPDGSGPLRLTCTTPPALLLSERVDVDPPALRFRFAAALEESRADALLVCALPANKAERMVDALLAAFGPASGEDAMHRDAAATAAELWHTVPPTVQREIAGAFRELEAPLSRTTLLAEFEERAACVGLLACGHVGVALHHLSDIMGHLTLDSADARGSALRRALLAFAFSEPYLRCRGS